MSPKPRTDKINFCNNKSIYPSSSVFLVNPAQLCKETCDEDVCPFYTPRTTFCLVCRSHMPPVILKCLLNGRDEFISPP